MYAKVEKYIFFALKKYRKINIPGYGVLEIVKKEVQSHPVHHYYEAPGDFIQFTPNAAHGMSLSDCLAQDAGLEIEKASSIIGDFMQEFTNKLETSNEADLKGIGVFFKQGKVIQFKAESDSSLTPENYGLFSFKASAPVKKKIVTPRKTEKKKKRKVPTFIFIFLFLGAAITASFFIFPEQSNEIWHKAISIFDKGDEEQVATNDSDIKDSTETDTTAIIRADTIFEDSLITDTQKTENINTDQINVTPHDNNYATSTGSGYHVIANCFRIKELADNYVASLKNQGFSQANILGVNSSGLHLVSYNNGFSTLIEAQKFMSEIQAKYGRTDLWIHCHNCN